MNYNEAEARRVTEDINIATGKIKDAMENNWTEFKNTFRTNWVGVDENAFEKSISTELVKLFANCDLLASAACSFVISAVQASNQFQSNLSQEIGGVAAASVADYVHSAKEVVLPVEEQTFTADQQLGLVTDNSQDALVSAIDSYIAQVTNAVTTSFGAIDVGRALQGEAGDKLKIDTLINVVADGMNKLTHIVDEFKNETIPTLVNAYKNQAETLRGDVDTATNSMNENVNNVL